MPRYALKLEYNGAPFAGWQRQTDCTTVQGAVEAALARLEDNVPTIAAAGRTDAGVHATGQVAHCDMARDWTPFRLSEALNYHLKPLPVAVLACARVEDDWHARFSAVERRYLYRIINRRAPLVHAAGQAWHLRGRLAVEPMQEAAGHLIGKHDFTTFRATICQARSPVKTLDALEIVKVPQDHGAELQMRLRARSFLHSQVRSIIGSLERVGSGGWEPADMKTALEAADRAACGPVAPPDGLYLTGVTYPDDPFESSPA
ncbi:tRNA pseudouridine(38-40) synthase TruA [Rhodophyticola sp. CCM32]|uniref:tRNA pseudouridine(38-40) synthase TruA n=1 Tax=Rhodophyticola sp. CCM32 TaxID=2916397 RepID=UPI00107F8ECE|nr:tRNA pseudouridine(38-40) synthase TruA [Rhodophyticola sp. CCM32]QBY00850.1 tRNA pseudouridine(38-40) synthase TruA [Rhodophyticola sp. CCM32]